MKTYYAIANTFGRSFVTKSKSQMNKFATAFSSIKEFDNKKNAQEWVKKETIRLRKCLTNNNLNDYNPMDLITRIETTNEDENILNKDKLDIEEVETEANNFGPIYVVKLKETKQESLAFDNQNDANIVLQANQPIIQKYTNFNELAKNEKYKTIEIYTDGSYLRQYPNIIIGAVIFVDTITKKIIKRYSFTKTLDEKDADSRTAEIFAVKTALNMLDKMNYDFALLNTDNTNVINLTDIEETDIAKKLKSLNTKVFFNHVKSHSKSYFNNFVDNMCREKIRKKIPFIDEQNLWQFKGNRILLSKLNQCELINDWSLLNDIDFKIIRKDFVLSTAESEDKLEFLSIGTSNLENGTFGLAIIKNNEETKNKFYKISDHNIFYQKY